MLDDTDDLNVSLIEVNSNPCLEFSCPLLERLLSEVIEGVFERAVDGHFPPPREESRTTTAKEAVKEISRLAQEREENGGGFEKIE